MTWAGPLLRDVPAGDRSKAERGDHGRVGGLWAAVVPLATTDSSGMSTMAVVPPNGEERSVIRLCRSGYAGRRRSRPSCAFR